MPATAPRRTLEECVAAHLPPDLLRGAAIDALGRGLVTPGELDAVERALELFGLGHDTRATDGRVLADDGDQWGCSPRPRRYVKRRATD